MRRGLAWFVVVGVLGCGGSTSVDAPVDSATDAAIDTAPDALDGGDTSRDAPDVFDAADPTDSTSTLDAADADVDDSVDAAPPACVVPGETSTGGWTSAAWVETCGGTTKGNYAAVTRIAVDTAGNVYVTGNFGGTMAVGPFTLVASGKDYDSFLAKLSPAGVPLWAHSYGGGGYCTITPTTLAIDATTNDVVLGGEYQDCGPSLGGPALPSTVGRNSFVARYTTFGAHLWSKGFLASSGIRPTAIVVLPSGALVAGFDLDGSIDFGGGSVGTAGPFSSFALVGLSSTGAHVWSKGYGSVAGSTNLGDLAVDPSGDLFVTGAFDGYKTNLGGADLVNPTGPLGVVGYLARFTATGGHVWSEALFGDAVGPQNLALAPAGDVFVGGSFEHAMSLPSCDLAETLPSHAIFVGRFGGDGSLRWARGLGNATDTRGSAMIADGAGGLLMTGNVIDAMDIGSTRVGGYAQGGYLLRFDGDGVYTRGEAYGDPAYLSMEALAIMPSGAPIVAGTFAGTFAFHGTSLTAAAPTRPDGTSVFLAPLAP